MVIVVDMEMVKTALTYGAYILGGIWFIALFWD